MKSKRMSHSKPLALLLAMLMVIAMVMSACAPPSDPNAVNSNDGGNTSTSDNAGTEDSGESGTKVVTMAMTDTWTSLYPYNGSGGERNTVVQSLIFDRLAVVGSDGIVYPQLSDEWEISEDYKTYTLHIVENATWHDGTPVTAHDVEFTYKYFSNAGTQCEMRPNSRYIAGTNEDGTCVTDNSIEVTALDDYHVEIVLKDPAGPEAFFNTATCFILPKHLLEDKDPATIADDDFWRNPVGSGPLKFDSMIDGERIEYTANEDYFLGAPQFDRFVIRVVPQSGMLTGLMSGEIDMLAGGQLGALTLSDFEMAQGEDYLVAEPIPSYTYHYISIDNSNPLMSQNVRLAIDRAINKQRIVDELLGGYGTVSVGPFSVDHPYFDPNLETDTYDPEEAKQLLEEAKWDSSTTLLLSVPANNTFREQAAALIQQDLAAVGINVEIRQYDSAAQFEAILDGSVELGIVGSACSVEPNNPNINLFDIYGAWCFGRFEDDTYLQYFNKGASYYETEDRLPIYYELQELLAEEMPYVYLCCPDALYAYNSRLSNINALNFTTYYPVWEWEVA